MKYQILKSTAEILEDKADRIKNFEKQVQQICNPFEYTQEKHQIYELDRILNPLSKELYIDIDEVITDKERAKKLKERIDSGLEIEEIICGCKIALEDLGYYESLYDESYSGYSSIYYYLIPHFDEEIGEWYYEEKLLYLPEVINIYSDVLNYVDKIKEEKKQSIN